MGLHLILFLMTPGLLATDIHIQIQIILTINLSEYVLINPINPHMCKHVWVYWVYQNILKKVYGQNNLNLNMNICCQQPWGWEWPLLKMLKKLERSSPEREPWKNTYLGGTPVEKTLSTFPTGGSQEMLPYISYIFSNFFIVGKIFPNFPNIFNRGVSRNVTLYLFFFSNLFNVGKNFPTFPTFSTVGSQGMFPYILYK